jgi:hypothetical protein
VRRVEHGPLRGLLGGHPAERKGRVRLRGLRALFQANFEAHKGAGG